MTLNAHSEHTLFSQGLLYRGIGPKGRRFCLRPECGGSGRGHLITSHPSLFSGGTRFSALSCRKI